MVEQYRVGEVVSLPGVDVTSLPSGGTWLDDGPGGLLVVVKVDDPTGAQRAATAYGRIAFGVRDRPGESVGIVQLGDPGRPGYIEAELDVGPAADWWGPDIAVVLCDRDGVVRARRTLTGPDTGFTFGVPGGDGVAFEPEVGDVRWAVFPRHRYGLLQPHGPMRTDAAILAAAEINGSAEWEPGFTEVWDLRFSSEFVIAPGDVGKLFEAELATKDRLAGSATFFFTAGRPLVTRAVRYYGPVVRPLGRHVRVFPDTAEGLRALGIDELPRLDPATPTRT